MTTDSRFFTFKNLRSIDTNSSSSSSRLLPRRRGGAGGGAGSFGDSAVVWRQKFSTKYDPESADVVSRSG